MSYTYCKACGCKNLYATQIPKFCNSCGEHLGSSVSKAATEPRIIEVQKPGKVARQKRRRPIMEDSLHDSEEFSNVDGVPEIIDFKYSTSSEGLNRTLKLRDIVDLEEVENEEQIEKAPKQKRKRGRPRKAK